MAQKLQLASPRTYNGYGGDVVRLGIDNTVGPSLLLWFEDDTFHLVVSSADTNQKSPVLHIFEAYVYEKVIYLSDVLVFQQRWVTQCCVSERLECIRKFTSTHSTAEPDTFTPNLWFEYPSAYQPRTMIHNGSVRSLPLYPACRASHLGYYQDLFPYPSHHRQYYALREQYGEVLVARGVSP